MPTCSRAFILKRDLDAIDVLQNSPDDYIGDNNRQAASVISIADFW